MIWCFSEDVQGSVWALLLAAMIFGAGGFVWSLMALRRFRDSRNRPEPAPRDDKVEDAFSEHNPGLGLAIGIVWLVIAVVAITGLVDRALK